MSFDHHAWRSLLSEPEGLVRLDEPLSKHTSLRLGGPAQVWAQPRTAQALERVAALAVEQGLPLWPVGLGSNSLFEDEGLPGVALRLDGELAAWRVVQEQTHQGEPGAWVEVGAGAINAHLVRGLLKLGLIGHEFLSLIPGTFGGAVAMNAGTKERELSSLLREVTLMWPARGRVERWPAHRLQMSYRHAALPEGALVLSGLIWVSRGDVDQARQNVQADKARRDQTQPYRLASAGSTFANPPGDYAGRLIEAVGLKGRRVGGAQISELHANFFINADQASAQDLLRLMALARARVRAHHGVELTPEVRFVGFDGWQRLAAFEQEWTDER